MSTTLDRHRFHTFFINRRSCVPLFLLLCGKCSQNLTKSLERARVPSTIDCTENVTIVSPGWQGNCSERCVQFTAVESRRVSKYLRAEFSLRVASSDSLPAKAHREFSARRRRSRTVSSPRKKGARNSPSGNGDALYKYSDPFSVSFNSADEHRRTKRVAITTTTTPVTQRGAFSSSFSRGYLNIHLRSRCVSEHVT